ncbi:MAG: GTPase domain-containing protein [Methylovulum sp.]|nr:GTPase domain-containing protein [Methylovulum sp.]
MAYDYSELAEKAQHWAEQAGAAGWLAPDAARQITELELRSPDSLFNNGARPLIVAFMGGSGVGKSTLLNRLAGKPIARTGIERPTSREVTLFHHHSVAIQQLPEQLPITQIKIAQHDEEAKKNIIWIDMPDFDSTEQSNKQLVLQWLPHIDVLLYVVSPERYRDEKAWQLLLAEGARHAWLFVLNQWDRGQIEQYDDFKQQLHKAGFFEPVIFKTVCSEDMQTDEFALLEETIVSLATDHIVEQLEQRGQQLRKTELKQKLQQTLQTLGDGSSFQHIQAQWQQQWQQTSQQLQQGFSWPIQQTAVYYAEHAADLISHPQAAQLSLWDAWAQTRLDDALDEFIINTDQQGLPTAPFKHQLTAIREKAAKIMQAQTEFAVRQALANPGNTVQRSFLKTMRVCEIFLPLAAIAWVGSQVFIGYYYSNMTSSHYLGVDFAVHSSLLIALTWLTPYFILKKVQPSLKKSALKGLQKGLMQALDLIGSEVAGVVATINLEHAEQLQKLTGIIAQCGCGELDPRLSIDSNSLLTRMLVGN